MTKCFNLLRFREHKRTTETSYLCKEEQTDRLCLLVFIEWQINLMTNPMDLFTYYDYPLRGYFLGLLTHTNAWDGQVMKLLIEF